MDKPVDIEDIIRELKKHNKYGIENVLKSYKSSNSSSKEFIRYGSMGSGCYLWSFIT